MSSRAIPQLGKGLPPGENPSLNVRSLVDLPLKAKKTDSALPRVIQTLSLDVGVRKKTDLDRCVVNATDLRRRELATSSDKTNESQNCLIKCLVKILRYVTRAFLTLCYCCKSQKKIEKAPAPTPTSATSTTPQNIPTNGTGPVTNGTPAPETDPAINDTPATGTDPITNSTSAPGTALPAQDISASEADQFVVFMMLLFAQDFSKSQEAAVNNAVVAPNPTQTTMSSSSSASSSSSSLSSGSSGNDLVSPWQCGEHIKLLA